MFSIVKHDINTQFPSEYRLMTDNEAVAYGEALVLSSGRLTKCGATATPEFISLRTQSAESSSVTPIPVLRVNEEQQFEVKSMATVASTVVGSKVTLHTDGLLVTATTTNGVFYVDSTDGATTTSTVRGHFRR